VGSLASNYCTDGITSGGIKGVAELEVLRLIEIELGGKLPIQHFFDLIVGTSTGGLIALGLGVKNWSVQECREYFVLLCDQAFTKRRGGGLPLVSWLVNNYHHSKYETTSIENALKQAFSEDELLFGGRKIAVDESNSPLQFSCKTAVTSTSAATNTTVLLTNYNRFNTERRK
jgi:Patatin-like phospholipase